MNKHFVICGASPDTGNLGVSALGNAVVAGLHQIESSSKCTILDSQKGIRETLYLVSNGDSAVTHCGARYSKRIYQKESFYNISFAAKVMPLLNSVSIHLLSASAFLDVSGGDSFTDLYGDKRFELVNAPKYFALRNNIPLVFLPQTYGPFLQESTRRKASQLVKSARLAWARDEHSFEILKDLLGDSFDSHKHKVGVDMAFILPVKKALSKINDVARDWLQHKTGSIIGINISGLIYNDPACAQSRYKFKADYNEVLELIVMKLLEDKRLKLILIPHVLTPPGHYESDYQASVNLLKKLGLENSSQVIVQEPTLDQCEVKWLISQVDWFMGTRMHATIAALSTTTPVCTIAYSDKALGVFETCAVGDCVIDPRILETGAVVAEVMASYSNRDNIKKRLNKSIPSVKAMAVQQMQDIADSL